MWRTPWVCARCLRGTEKRPTRQFLRFQSTSSSTSPSYNLIYPALLERARSVAQEHKVLQSKLLESYDGKIAKRAGELSPIANALKSWDKAQESVEELNYLIRDPNADAELKSLAEEDLEQTVGQLKDASQSLTASLVPKHPFAELPCLLEIRPGIGGGEANLFAMDLLHMYKAYCVENGLRVSLIHYDNGGTDGTGLVEGILEIESPGSYGKLRSEAGVHRVQRVPATETKGRVHTSTASVMVLPSFPQTEDADLDVNDPSSDFYIDPRDIKRDVMRASGAGGQHVNRTESAVRLTHVPTNTVVAMQESRSQAENEKKAWAVLRSRLAQSRREAREQEMIKLRRSVIGVAKVGRADKVRTYNWQQQRVTDHRSGITVHGIDGIMSGGMNLEKVMESVRTWMAESEIQDLIAAAESEQAKR